MINTKEAYAEIEKDDDPKNNQPADTATEGQKVVDKVETEPDTKKSTDDKAKDEVKDATEPSPKTDTDGDKKSKQQYTAQEKINFSFSKLKKKHAAEVDELNKKIAEQQKIIDEFNKKARDAYKDDDEYLDAKLDAREAQRELARSREESVKLKAQQNAETMRERVGKLYPSENLHRMYEEAVEIGQRNGALQAMMGDETIKKYIFDSDKSPLLVEAFCRKPQLLQKILDTSDSRKPFAMYDIEQRLSAMIEKAASQAASQSTTNSQPQATPTIPVVGKVANAGGNKSAPADDWASEKELFQYARSR